MEKDKRSSPVWFTQKFHSLFQSSDLRHPPWKQLIICTSASFSGTIQQTLVQRSPGLLDLLRHPWHACVDNQVCTCCFVSRSNGSIVDLGMPSISAPNINHHWLLPQIWRLWVGCLWHDIPLKGSPKKTLTWSEMGSSLINMFTGRAKTSIKCFSDDHTTNPMPPPHLPADPRRGLQHTHFYPANGVKAHLELHHSHVASLMPRGPQCTGAIYKFIHAYNQCCINHSWLACLRYRVSHQKWAAYGSAPWPSPKVATDDPVNPAREKTTTARLEHWT